MKQYIKLRFDVGWKLTVPVCATIEVPLPPGEYRAIAGGDAMRLLLVYGEREVTAEEFESKSLQCVNHHFVVMTMGRLLVCRGSMFSSTRSVEIERRS